MAAGAATRIPSSDDSGFPATGHDGPRPPLQGRVASLRGSASLPWKPEAQAEGMRMAAGAATRIPSSDDSGFPANGHDGPRPPLQGEWPRSVVRHRCPGSPRRKPRECGWPREQRRGFPQLTIRASQQPGTTVRDRRSVAQASRLANPGLGAAGLDFDGQRPPLQGRVSSLRGSASLPWKPEAQAEGMRMAAGTATRIPSAYASGFPANGHDGQPPPLQGRVASLRGSASLPWKPEA